MIKIHPYLNFDSQCEVAFKFYEKLLGGKIVTMQTHGDSPMAAQTPPDWHKAILHARLVVGDQVLMGSDAPPQYHHKPQGFSVSLNIDTPAEADRIYSALAENATIQMPIQETFWAKRFGMLTDRFGIPWIVNCEKAAS
jgi:PhnB protein